MATVFDLFCGTGGFSYGFEKASPEFETRFGIDVLQVATQTFKANHRSANVVCGDIRKLRRKQVEQMTGLGREEVDVIVGGLHARAFLLSDRFVPQMTMTRETHFSRNLRPS